MSVRYCTSVLLAFVSLAVLAGPASASEVEDTLSIRFANAPYHGAFVDAKQAWNHIGPVEIVRAGISEPDVVVESFCVKPSWTGVHIPRTHGPDIIKINRCAGLSLWERRENYAHEIGHALSLEHMTGNTIMTEDMADAAGWKPTGQDVRMVGRSF